MARASIALGATAILLAAVDLAHKAAAGAVTLHPRSATYVVVVTTLTIAWVAAILAARSVSLAIGGGVVAGGALGNLASDALWPGVPNPIVLGSIAFNLADVFVVAGFIVVAAAVLALAARSPDRLREPISLRP
jgi:lipoprotein signal peptidase